MASESDGWSEEELRASVQAYISIRKQVRRGDRVNKAAVYRELAVQFPARSGKSFERRMQNISHIYALMGRSWIPGLLPAKNVGSAVAKQIERLIQEEEDNYSAPVVEFNDNVSKLLDKPKRGAPVGNKQPPKITSQATTFVRDPEVVAYVLYLAEGCCECCKKPAPFKKPDGSIYLEVHHLRRLADGGSDTPSNAAALCPNCHRELHYGASQEDLKASLYDSITRLIPE